jgi:hypothetical protein
MAMTPEDKTAAVVFIVGVAVSVETLRRNGGPPGGDPRKFFAIPLGDITTFGVLVGAAVQQRQQSDTHKRLMLLATISLLTAAVGRFLPQMGMGGAPNLFYGTDVFVLALVIYDLVSRGRVHPATLWGGAMVVGFKPLLFYVVAVTSPWLALADALRILVCRNQARMSREGRGRDAFPSRPATSPGTDETSQVPHKELLHVRKVSDCARFCPCKPLRHGRCCLLVSERDRQLGIRPVSQLNTRPVVSPVNASRLP